jgi:hypothetical protein
MMEYVQPKIAIPLHYRLPEPDFPIPADYLMLMKEEDVRKGKEMQRAAILGHQYPSPKNPVAEIERQREDFMAFTRVIEVKAGRRYTLPADISKFEGRRR